MHQSNSILNTISAKEVTLCALIFFAPLREKKAALSASFFSRKGAKKN